MPNVKDVIIFDGTGFSIISKDDNVNPKQPSITLTTDHEVLFFTNYIDARFPSDGNILSYRYLSDDYIRAVRSNMKVIGVTNMQNPIKFESGWF